MSRRPELYAWQADLANHFPNLSPAFVGLLALWSFGIILARRCGLSSAALQLPALLGGPANTARQRLREFCQEAPAKAGAKRGLKRKDFDPADGFAPLLTWVLSFWPGRRLALALGATSLGDRFTAPCISAVYGGLAIPVAWKVLPANTKGAWHPHWCGLIARLKPALGPGWEVVALSDRGLESPRLFREIVAAGWHPLMRVQARGMFRPAGWVGWYAMAGFVPRVGARFAAAGTAYRTQAKRLSCTLLACGGPGHEEAWLALTDLPVAASSPCWYAFRAWIEQGFKLLKRGGPQWQGTRMSDPARAGRLWLALAVATLWLAAIGAVVESGERKETIGALPRGAGGGRRPRAYRLFARGLAVWLAAAVRGAELPRGPLPPEPWAEPWHDVPVPTERDLFAEFLPDETYP